MTNCGYDTFFLTLPLKRGGEKGKVMREALWEKA
jgi:hypothetical protein